MDRRILRTKEALFHTLISLMYEKDFNEITISEIADKANYNRGTFYAHYSSKEDLLNEVIEEELEQLRELLLKPYLEEDTVKVGSVQPSALNIFEHISSNYSFYNLMLKHNVKSDFQDKLFKVIKEHITEEVITEFSVSNHEIDPEIHAYYTAYSIIGLVYFWLESDNKYTPYYMAKQYTKLLTNPPRQSHFSKDE